MNSLDPRVSRLPQIGEEGKMIPKASLDQFATFEVFVKAKEDKPFQHEGSVHSPSLELAYVFAKENFTRRFTCYSICVVDTSSVFVSQTTEENQSAYDLIENKKDQGTLKNFEIYHLLKRGKQHIHVGSVEAATPESAMTLAKELYGKGNIVYNVWVIPRESIRFTQPADLEIWFTLPEKKFRDAIDYKGGDKLNNFLEKRKLEK